MKRITVEEVKEAYAKTGLVPVKADYYHVSDGKECGCGAFAVGCLRDPEMRGRVAKVFASDDLEDEYHEHEDEAEERLRALFGNTYLVGFTLGFDGKSGYGPLGDLDPYREGLYREGLEDGRAASNAVFKDA